MNTINENEFKEQFKELVHQIKFQKKRPDGKRFRNEDIAQALDYELPYFNTLVGTKGKVTDKHIEKVRQAFPDVLEEENLTKSNNKEHPGQEEEQETDPIKENHIRLRMNLKNGRKLTPATNIKAAAGHIVIINDQPELVLEWIDIPFLKDVQGTVEVFGNSMFPKYPSGSRVAVKLLEHKTLIRPGEDYFVIDINYEGYIKRLYRMDSTPDFVELRSYNPDKIEFPDFVMKWEEIIAVFKVRAGIQLT